MPFSILPCRVQGCRHPVTHVTSAHVCGRCHHMGHGRLECGSPGRIAALGACSDERMPPGTDPCAVAGGAQPWTHRTSAHHCTSCGARGGGAAACCGLSVDPPPVTLTCPVCRAVGPVRLDRTVFTAAACVVCFDEAPCVIFEACRHASVCAACAARLLST